MNPEGTEKTKLISKYGNFEYLVFPIVICNTPATSQLLINSIFADFLDVFLVVYLDGLLIYSETGEEQLQRIEMDLSRLRLHELYVGKETC